MRTVSRQPRVHPGSSPQNAGPVARRPRTLLSVACRPPKIVYSHTASYAQRAADLLDVVVGLLSAHAPSLPEALRTRWERFVRVPKGEPDHFLTEAELLAKFSALSAPVLGQERSAALAELVLRLDECANLGAICRLAAPTAGARLAGD